MKTLNSWQDTLEYVNKLGIAPRTMPIGWKQQVLMNNVNAIEALHDPNKPMYPLKVRYYRYADCFMVRNLTVKAIHR